MIIFTSVGTQYTLIFPSSFLRNEIFLTLKIQRLGTSVEFKALIL